MASDVSSASDTEMMERLAYYSRPLSPLCSVCRFILGQIAAWHESTLGSIQTDCTSTPEGQTFERFLKAIKNECLICYRVWNYDQRRAEAWECFGTDTWCPLTYCWHVDTERRGAAIFMMSIYQQSPVAVLCDPNDPAIFYLSSVGGFFFGDELAIAVDHNTGSPETLQRAVDWYQSCRLSHGKCSSLPTRRPGWLPSRLIDIGQAEDDSWKLVITADSAGKLLNFRYATLSYRWGSKPQALMLNTLTLGGFLGGNPIAELPQTFKDFIVVARKLGFKYVWIDCLCIMQDCSQDWNHEASTMRDVYANSGCNVVACDSSDPGGGLFRFRNPVDILPGLVETSLSSGKPQRYIVRDDMFYRRQRDDVKGLADRGWVFQERFLAPRLLSFHGQRISWECCEGCEWEGTFPASRESISIMDELLDSTQQGAEAPHGQMTEATIDLWSKMVTLYSQCKLTKSEDKLLAFVGVAKVFQELTGDTYLAGVWKSQLHIQLEWSTSGPLTKLPSRYRAPSWSWASVDSSVKAHQPFLRDLDWISKDPTFFEILGVSVTANAFGGMADASDGLLKVRGKCFGCSYEKIVGDSYTDESFSFQPDGNSGVKLSACVRADATEYVLADEGRTTLLLYAVSSQDEDWGLYKAMILQPHSSSENAYRRAGWAGGMIQGLEDPANRAWFKRIADTELTIF